MGQKENLSREKQQCQETVCMCVSCETEKVEWGEGRLALELLVPVSCLIPYLGSCNFKINLQFSGYPYY